MQLSDNKNENHSFTIEQLHLMLDKVPLCINVLNEKAESIYCNSYTVELYGVASKKEFGERFYELTPEFQASGKTSKIMFAEYVLEALEKEEIHFGWLDKKSDGEELPLNISIYRLNMKDELGDELFLSIMQDLRPLLAHDKEGVTEADYYHSRITYKALFNTVAELTDEWFWIFDNNIQTIQFFGKGREILGLSPDRKPFPEYVIDSGVVYPDDLQTFLQFNENLKAGAVEPIEVRFMQSKGVTKYYRITYKTMYNKDGKAMFSIGKTYDIDKQKRLEKLSKTDLLTNCLNKITTENIIKDSINTAPTSSHALFLIDIDNFKSVNDNLGHYFGDVALSEVAKNLHSNFRGGDVIGRIGGDEFLVFVKDISDEVIIEGKARAIARAFQNSYSGENKDYKISGSIGVALYPKHASTYEELYKCADKALYSSKAMGKDRYTVYSNEMANSSTQNLTAVDNGNQSTNAYFDGEITSLLFDIMYQSENVGQSMNTVLRLFGNYLKVDRCYIAQTGDEGEHYSVTYEWAMEGIESNKEKFQDIPVDILRRIFRNLEANGIMYHNYLDEANEDIEGIQKANSYLLVQTKSKGSSRLILGVDDQSEHRVWSEKEINTVQYVLKLISIFLDAAKRKGI